MVPVAYSAWEEGVPEDGSCTYRLFKTVFRVVQWWGRGWGHCSEVSLIKLYRDHQWLFYSKNRGEQKQKLVKCAGIETVTYTRACMSPWPMLPDLAKHNLIILKPYDSRTNHCLCMLYA